MRGFGTLMCGQSCASGMIPMGRQEPTADFSGQGCAKEAVHFVELINEVMMHDWNGSLPEWASVPGTAGSGSVVRMMAGLSLEVEGQAGGKRKLVRIRIVLERSFV